MEVYSIVHAIGIALTLSAMYQLSIAQEQKFQPHLDIIAEIESEFDCEQILGKTERASEAMVECKNIMNSEVVLKTKEYMLKATMEEMEQARIQAFRKHPKMQARRKRSAPNSCPVMDKIYFQKHREMSGLRSLSPYQKELTYNAKRFPKYMLQNRCLCKGCINPNTGKETMDFVSQLIKAEARAFYINSSTGLYTLGKEEIRVGCTCVRPIYD